MSLVLVLILHGMKGVSFWAYIISSYFFMGLDIGLAEVPVHPICWAFALIASLIAMPMGLLAVISAI